MSGVDEKSAVAGASVVDDWESIGGDQVQQLTNQRLSLAEQQQKASVMEQQVMNERVDSDGGLPAIMPNKPIKLLKREQPTRQRTSDTDAGEEAAQLGNLSIDERKANYDKIRERIFAAASMDKDEPVPEDPKKSPKKSAAVSESDPQASNDVMIETINYLSNVQMLSEQTPAPHGMRPPPVQPPLWIPPRPLQELRSIPPLQFLPPDMPQAMPLYGMPPPRPLCFVPPPDFSRPPPPPYSSTNQSGQKYKH